MTPETEIDGWRIGVDTGGTFTDLILVDDAGRIATTCKLLSTPHDPGRAVLQGVDRLLQSAVEQGVLHPDQAAGFAGQVIHGSTVATNALLERKTDPAALITTAGFEDLLILARQDRPDLYALTPSRPLPPIPREHVIGVHERLGYDGAALTTLAQHEIDRVIDELRTLNVSAVVVCLLHSYANDSHERQIADAIREKLPELHLTVSSALLPEMREYERASTCAVNAVVGPTMTRYIAGLDHALGEGRLRIMASGGGTLPPKVVAQRPVETVVSGPAGGVIGAWAMAQSVGEARIIGFDMGGTSTDVSLCDDGLTKTTETTINGMPIRLPMIDIHTVGAGGGSLAWVDEGGALRVGPQSAGADPGPACYGRQGDEPELATVTDAHAVLGHLRDGRLLGDTIQVDAKAARRAVGTIAARLGLSIEAAAEGILRVADSAMARAINRVSVQRGHDVRAYTLLAFGGAGGLHACRLADVLGMTRVLVPVHGGLLSAFGMLAAPTSYAFSHGVLRTYEQDGTTYADPSQDDAVAGVIGGLLDRADRALTADGVAVEIRTLNIAFDLRFAGQSHEITIQAQSGRNTIERFIEDHHRLYGYAPAGKLIELVTVRVEVLGPKPQAIPGALPTASRDEKIPAGFVHRDHLCCGQPHAGPIVIEEYAATTVVPAGWSAKLHSDGQIMIDKQGGADA